MRTSPRLTEESLGKFYTEHYPRIYKFSADEQHFSSKQRAEERFLEQKLRGVRLLRDIGHCFPTDRNPVVFAVGCNTGASLIAFRDAGVQCFGCDLCASGFERGRREGLTLIEGDESALSAYRPADLIILSHVLEHLPHPHQTIRNLKSLLRDDGILYIELPGIMQFHQHPLGMMRFLQNAHLYHFTLGTLTELMRSEGFDLVQGNQGIAAYYRNTSRGTRPMRRRLCKPHLIFLYIFFVEILYQARLLPPFTFVAHTAHKGVRHLFKDLWHFVSGKCFGSPQKKQSQK
jgi:SAM-dependent methyltransferase